ncbi:hypothetical protein DH2020_008947 [Rehmannia glutinosa]|uniref:Dof zinc finger protein n=1 Tax=Rehmannia glutinosa TaxID=99300 RepID=A0ABR0X872_REHGL
MNGEAIYRSKHLFGDHHQLGLIDWAQTPPKPPFTRRQKPPPHHQLSEPLNCPRCNSTNTKFCYYNNYNKSQPRHFCKSCKRHWTKGGTLRNVPVGGGRKNKRPKTSTAAAAEPRQQHCRNIPSNIPCPALVSSSLINSSLDVNTSVIINNINPTSYQSLNDGIIDYYQSVEESTITSLDIPTNSSLPAWPVLDTSTSAVDQVSNYWNWNEIDLFANSSNDLNYIV